MPLFVSLNTEFFKFKRGICFFLIFLFWIGTLYPQKIDYNISKGVVETYVMPPISNDSLQILQSQNPNLFAFPFYVSINVTQDATSWIENDTMFYALQIVSKDAFTLNVIFETCILPNGASLYIHNPDFSSIAGPFVKRNYSKSTVLASPLIQGDTICIFYKEPRNTEYSGILKLTQVSHDFKGDSSPSLLKAEAQACNININCPPGLTWQNEKRSVVKISIDGTSFCSGTLINNTAKNLAPFVLTANHCLSTQTSAESCVFYFGYEYETCANDGILNSSKTMYGSDLVATAPNDDVDFTLLKMFDIPPSSYNPYYSGWNADDNLSSSVVCIHHPRGDAKKISVENQIPSSDTFLDYVNLSHWRIAKWDLGTTEGGSSGSALFNTSHQVIGTLTGGEADCTDPINDYFSKFSVAWDYFSNDNAQLKKWLDPLNTGVTSCDGFDPLLIPSHLVTNITAQDSLYIYDFDNAADGLWTGVNEISWNKYADLITWTENKKIYAISFVGQIDDTENLSDIIFKVWDGTGMPNNFLYQTELRADMINGNLITIIPDQPIVTDGSFWVGYEVLGNSKAFVSYMAKPRLTTNSLYVNHPQSWLPTTALGCNSSLAVQLHVTNNSDTLVYPLTVESPFFISQIFPELHSLKTPELFGIDSLPSIKDTTTYLKVASEKNISDWAGVNELHANCFANKYTISDPIYIRSIKIAPRSIPDTSFKSKLVIWNQNFTNILSEQTISNSILKEDYFNQIHLDSILFIDDDISIGVCYDDTAHYDKNISLYQFYDKVSTVDGYFSISNKWFKYLDFDILYNVAIQPITCFSQYHFNPDSSHVLYYPLLNIAEKIISVSNDYVIFPIPADESVTIQFLKTFYSNIDICIYNTLGNILFCDTYFSHNGLITVPISTLENGIYILKIKVDNKEYTEKIIKNSKRD